MVLLWYLGKEQDLNNFSVKLHMYFPYFYALHILRVRKTNQSKVGTKILEHGMSDEILYALNGLLTSNSYYLPHLGLIAMISILQCHRVRLRNFSNITDFSSTFLLLYYEVLYLS